MADSSEKLPGKIEDFHILRLTLPPLPSLPISATHNLYLKPHSPKIPHPSASRSLFLVNIPIDSTPLHFKALFSHSLGLAAGRIESIELSGSINKPYDVSTPVAPFTATTAAVAAAKETDGSGNGSTTGTTGKKNKKRKRNNIVDPEDIPIPPEANFPPTWDRELYRSGSTCVLVFVDKESMKAALRAVQSAHETGRTVTWGEGLKEEPPALGSKRYLTHETLSYPPKSVLLAAVNAHMTAYNAREEAQAQKLARQRQEPDADGFVTVTRGGRNAAARMGDAKEVLERQREKRRKNEEAADFYRFQGRERRKERAEELVRKFEEDKERVRGMRAVRGSFRPES